MNVNDILDRVKLFLNAKSDNELSLKLGKFPSYIAQLKKRGSIDIDLILDNCPDVDLNWLLTGEKLCKNKCFADFDDKGNRVEIKVETSLKGFSPVLNLEKIELSESQKLKEALRKKFYETNLEELKKEIDLKNNKIESLMDKLYNLQQLVAEYQLRDRK